MTSSRLQKILHVDDDAVMRMMTKKALQRSNMGFEVISCASGHEFIDIIQSFSPDLLLVDMIMPIMNGQQLISVIRQKTAPTSTIPVIFITGQSDVQFENRPALEPIIGIIQKPFSPTHLGDDLIHMWDSWQKEKSG